MTDQTDKIYQRFLELSSLVSSPEVLKDIDNWKKLVKERTKIEPIALQHEEILKAEKEIQSISSILVNESDKEMKNLLEEELHNQKHLIEKLEEEMKILLLPKDENDDKNVIIEIRGGAGGEEAALFARELFSMYVRFAERKGWKAEVSDLNETEIGGVKEVSFLVRGKGAWSKLKFESGVHRVQRVPETESQGRIHTSTVTVAVLPEVEDVDFEILDKDIKVDTYRSSGAGGQHVNKTDSAIRITHFPTGIVVACQDERSQLKNKERAFSILKSKLYDYYKTKQDEEYSKTRHDQIGTGDRSERIRTYNFPQGRVTDHRINLSAFNIDDFLDGNIEFMLDELSAFDQKEKLSSLS